MAKGWDVLLWALIVTTTFASPDKAAIKYSYPACATGITCFSVTPPDKPNFTFDCARGQPPAGQSENTWKGQVYLMHGNDGAMSKGMFFDTMIKLAGLGFATLACDARGYSPGAAPNNQSAYNYNELQGDIFSIVNASGFNDNFGGKFHLVAHDQGARVSWHAIALGEARRRLLSFATLSIPHSDVFSDALYGPIADPAQQAAAQYVRMLVLPNSTTAYKGIYDHVCLPDRWVDAATCQKVLWWYNGAIDSGAMALAPMLPFGAIAKWIGIPYDTVKNNTQYPLAGVGQTVKVGRVSEFPVLYACGLQDTSDLCETKFGEESHEYIDTFTYMQMQHCGHNVLGCRNATELAALQQAICDNINSAYAST